MSVDLCLQGSGRVCVEIDTTGVDSRLCMLTALVNFKLNMHHSRDEMGYLGTYLIGPNVGLAFAFGGCGGGVRG